MTSQTWQDLLRLASQLRSSGRISDAIAAYKQLLQQKHDLPDSWYNLGFLQRQVGAFEEALHSYNRALELGIEGPEEVHLNRAVIFSDYLHRPEEAEQELRSALAKNPAYVPALLNLGNLLEDIGRRQEARGTYQQALAADGENSLALARLAGVSHAPQLNADVASRLRAKIANPATSAAEKADLGFALAALLDAAAKYEAAFNAARAANQASQAASGLRYDRRAVERFIDLSIAAFQGATARFADAPSPVFICGMFRSGSSLVEQILAGHPRVRAAGELDALPMLLRAIPGYPESAASAGEDQIRRWREQYVGRLPYPPSASQIVTDKRPDNFLYLGFIKMLFPSAKIIHTRRDPLDNLLSLYFLHLDPSFAYAFDLDDAAHWYMQYERLMAHWKSLFADDILDVEYDRLVRDPEPSISAMLNFLALEQSEGLLDFHQNPRPVKTASVWQVREPIHNRSSGRWRNYERHLLAIQQMLGAAQAS